MINFSFCYLKKRLIILSLLFGLFPIQAGKKYLQPESFQGQVFRCTLPKKSRSPQSTTEASCNFMPEKTNDRRAITEHIETHIPYLRCPKNCQTNCLSDAALRSHFKRKHPNEKLSPGYCPDETIKFLKKLIEQLNENDTKLKGFEDTKAIKNILEAAKSFADDKKQKVAAIFKDNGWSSNHLETQISGQKRTNSIQNNNPKSIREEELKQSLEQILGTIDMSIFSTEKKEEESLDTIITQEHPIEQYFN